MSYGPDKNFVFGEKELCVDVQSNMVYNLNRTPHSSTN